MLVSVQNYKSHTHTWTYEYYSEISENGEKESLRREREKSVHTKDNR